MNLLDLPKILACFAIRFYQKTISFDHGPMKIFHPYGYCRFHPTCSEYSRQAICRFGILKGGIMSLWRVVRCHPWAKGGTDEVSEIKK